MNKTMAEMRQALVEDILDRRDQAELREAVESYVECYTDETVLDDYRHLAAWKLLEEKP